MADDPLASASRRLLVAKPALLDPNFARTVVFVIEHTDDGAIGLVLNRPTEAELTDAVPEWASLAAPPAVAFVGGPVQQEDAVIGLGELRRIDVPVDESDAWEPLLGAIGTVDLGRDPVDVRGEPIAVRVFAGYAGWGAGQLDDEIAEGSWFVVDALPADLLTRDPSALWRVVLRRQGGDLAVTANHPLDPATN
jgi:putative transcriptional regulator